MWHKLHQFLLASFICKTQLYAASCLVPEMQMLPPGPKGEKHHLRCALLLPQTLNAQLKKFLLLKPDLLEFS
jgi:hypothetical protein